MPTFSNNEPSPRLLLNVTMNIMSNGYNFIIDPLLGLPGNETVDVIMALVFHCCGK